MKTENLSTLKIHKLSQEQYDRELAAGRIDETALYLTPDNTSDPDKYATQEDLDTHITDKDNPHGVELSHLGVTATADELNVLDGIKATVTELNYMDGVTSNVQMQLDAKANKADIATTKYVVTASDSVTYHKIYDFGAWGTGAWYRKGFSMLVTSRAGEIVWVTIAANDSNTSASAIRLMDRYSKIRKIYYSVSESAIYVEASAWANNICAHILTNVGGDYVPTVSTVSAMAEDAVEIPIIPFGVDSDSTNIGSSALVLNMAGSNDRPTYNDVELALVSDITTPDVSGQIGEHNGNASAHTDIRNSISSHTTNTSNPHGVTAAQIGAAPTTHYQAASTITAGTFAGQVVASSAGQTPTTSCVRNSRLVATDTNPTINGEIVWIYG